MKLSIQQKSFITGKVYKIIRCFTKPIIEAKFHPIVLNKPQEVINAPILIAPNHRATLDPFFISVYSNRSIHWVALKRFFTGEDSIFNNSKNPILCKSTILLFKGIGAIPVMRKRDVDFTNPEMVKQYHEDERKTVKMINEYLQNKDCVGIFPEESTNKNPTECPIQLAKTGFVHFARKKNAVIQPVSITWISKEIPTKSRVIINFRPVIQATDKDETMKKWNETILAGLEENERLIERLPFLDGVETKMDLKVLLKEKTFTK